MALSLRRQSQGTTLYHIDAKAGVHRSKIGHDLGVGHKRTLGHVKTMLLGSGGIGSDALQQKRG